MTDDAKILQFEPWGDDDTPYVTFSDRIVVTRVQSECAICFSAIRSGDRVRTQVQRCEDYGVKTFRFCVECCAAMLRRYQAREEGDPDVAADMEMEIERRYDVSALTASSRKEGA